MNPRESALLSAAATLLGHNRDTAYGPAHAVRDALALETEVAQQLGARNLPLTDNERGQLLAEMENQRRLADLRTAGAL